MHVDTSMLSEMGDSSLAEEITTEAVRMGVSDALGGFDGFELSRDAEKGAFLATVDFQALTTSVEQLQSQNYALSEALRAVREASEVCSASLSTASVEEMRVMLDALLHTAQSYQQAEDNASAPQPPSLIAAVESRSDESDSSSSSQDAYRMERDLMGYQRLLGDDECPSE